MPGGSHRVGKEGGSWREPRQLSAEQRGDREPASLGYGRRVGTAPQGDIKGRIDPENDPKAALALTGAGLKFGQVQLGQLVSSPAITRRNGGKVVVHGMSITAPAGVDLVDNTCGTSCSFTNQRAGGRAKLAMPLRARPDAAQARDGHSGP